MQRILKNLQCLDGALFIAYINENVLVTLAYLHLFVYKDVIEDILNNSLIPAVSGRVLCSAPEEQWFRP